MPKLSDIHNEFVELLPDAAFVTADCVQVGLCIAVYDHESGPGSWMLYPYNFYLYPAEVSHSGACCVAPSKTGAPVLQHETRSQDEVMHFHSGTVKWLKDNGFDFMRWIDDGLPYIRLSAANTMTDKTKRSKSACRWGIQKLFEAIKQHRIPLVVHNGLMDLYHIYDKFVGPLPQDPDDIVKAFYSWFGLGVYDTKHVARYLHDNNLCDLKK
ncbi:CAF1 family ribonuclease [Babesia caballi]|uniref:CAF1 family ribonuclease n=1 Tax=Babesia caballi TaxID=5871 RepID=A0AAV4M0Z4_BABCB|nr:CAF1 family ribonuclease [Babesia caballi]